MALDLMDQYNNLPNCEENSTASVKYITEENGHGSKFLWINDQVYC